MVMGILVLSGAYNTGELFRDNDFMRYLLGAILFVYGIFRAYNAYLKIKHPVKRKLRYYDDDDDDNP